MDYGLFLGVIFDFFCFWGEVYFEKIGNIFMLIIVDEL